MRIVRFMGAANGDSAHIGVLIGDGDFILDLSSVVSHSKDRLAFYDLDGECFSAARGMYERAIASADSAQLPVVPLRSVRLLAPVERPGKLIAIGLNYRDHAIESNLPIPERPLVFSKFTSSIVGPSDQVVLPSGSTQVDYEAEMGVVIGRRTKGVSKLDAMEHVLGYMCLNDVSARDFQFADGQWQRGKSCDTFAPIGPFIATAGEIPDPHQLGIKLRLNGDTMQDSSTAQLIFGIPELIEFLSATITLEPGDVIATGTPPGVGFARKPPVFLKNGDVMEVEIEGLGVLANTCIAE